MNTKAKESLEKGTKMFKDFMKARPVDREGLMKIHRRNMESIMEANKMAVEVMKSLTQMQTQYFKSVFEEMVSNTQELMKSGSTEDFVSRQSNNFRQNLGRSLEHGREISETLSRTQQEMYDIFHSRLNDGVKEAENLKKKMH